MTYQSKEAEEFILEYRWWLIGIVILVIIFSLSYVSAGCTNIKRVQCQSDPDMYGSAYCREVCGIGAPSPSSSNSDTLISILIIALVFYIIWKWVESNKRKQWITSRGRRRGKRRRRR